jgi:Tfp pilus assembly protein PilO
MFWWIFAAAVVFWGSVLGGGFYFARRHVRALEHRSNDEGELTALRQRVARLEEALEGTQRDLERLETSHELTNRQLPSRSNMADLPPNERRQ